MQTPGAVRTPGSRLRLLVWMLFGLTFAVVITAAAWRLRFASGRDVDLPVYGSVPSFTLVERSGRPLTAADLSGRVWIADFIFTRCAGTCPALTTALAALVRRLPATAADGGILAVSFTVDPARDDAETLRRYAEKFGADPSRWLFATGERDTIERIVRDGFRLSIAELPSGEREAITEPITHSDRFALVDRALRIRGYYQGTDPEDVARLERDAVRLAAPGA